jgi:hypothetical protein
VQRHTFCGRRAKSCATASFQKGICEIKYKLIKRLRILIILIMKLFCRGKGRIFEVGYLSGGESIMPLVTLFAGAKSCAKLLN